MVFEPITFERRPELVIASMTVRGTTYYGYSSSEELAIKRLCDNYVESNNTCPECNGEGTVEVDVGGWDYPDTQLLPCSSCKEERP